MVWGLLWCGKGGQGRGKGDKGRGTNETHGFAEDEDEVLVGDCVWGGEEEVGQSEVEEGEGADEGCGG